MKSDFVKQGIIVRRYYSKGFKYKVYVRHSSLIYAPLETKKEVESAVRSEATTLHNHCDLCGHNFEYDEGENKGSGFVCYECINEEKFGDLKE